MMSYITMFFGGVVYTLIGLLMNEIVKDYMKEMVQKVERVDKRFVNRLFITVTAKSERIKDVKSMIMFLFWPIMDIAVILKAEWQYNSIRKHVYYKGAP